MGITYSSCVTRKSRASGATGVLARLLWHGIAALDRWSMRRHAIRCLYAPGHVPVRHGSTVAGADWPDLAHIAGGRRHAAH